MSLTPVEVRHLELRRGLFGYRRAGVRKAMDEIADSFEAVWRERAELVRARRGSRGELGAASRAREPAALDPRLGERAAQDLKEQARREADVIVSEANAESRRIVRDAITEKERSRRARASSRSCAVRSTWWRASGSRSRPRSPAVRSRRRSCPSGCVG